MSFTIQVHVFIPRKPWVAYKCSYTFPLAVDSIMTLYLLWDETHAHCVPQSHVCPACIAYDMQSAHMPNSTANRRMDRPTRSSSPIPVRSNDTWSQLHWRSESHYCLSCHHTSYHIFPNAFGRIFATRHWKMGQKELLMFQTLCECHRYCIYECHIEWIYVLACTMMKKHIFSPFICPFSRDYCVNNIGIKFAICNVASTCGVLLIMSHRDVCVSDDCAVDSGGIHIPVCVTECLRMIFSVDELDTDVCQVCVTYLHIGLNVIPRYATNAWFGWVD